MNEISDNSFGSIFRNPSETENCSLYLVARKRPAIIPISEKILLRNPFFNPNKTGIRIKIIMIISKVFKNNILNERRA